eukprot:3744761-Rhodomonas_salina.1
MKKGSTATDMKTRNAVPDAQMQSQDVIRRKVSRRTASQSLLCSAGVVESGARSAARSCLGAENQVEESVGVNQAKAKCACELRASGT